MIVDPPLPDGAVKLMTAWPLPPVAVAPVGEPATVIGVTEPEAPEAGPVLEKLFVAVTVKV